MVTPLDPGAEYGSWQQSLDIAVGAFDAGESWSANAGTGSGKLLYEVLFNVDRDNRRWLLYPTANTRVPNSAARYQQLF